MKKDWFDYMLKVMRKNKDVFLLFGGLGWPRIDEFLKEFPDRAFNFEASEQTLLDASVGLAYAGKQPWVYTITPFYWRAAETIRTYISHEWLNIKLCGAGRNTDYSKSDGFSHDGKDIAKLLDILYIEQLYPETNDDMRSMVDWMLQSKNPQFLSLRR